MTKNVERITSIQESMAVRCIKNKQFDLIEFLPYFQSTDKKRVQGATAKKLLEKLAFEFDEDNENIQEEFYLLLDKVMDTIIELRYEREKRRFDFTSVDQIDYQILKTFKAIDKYNKDYHLKNLTYRLIRKITDKTYSITCYNELERLYQIYSTTSKLPHEATNHFYNEILNKQRDCFFRLKKEEFLEELKNELPYTKKKEKIRIIRAKLQKIDHLLQTKDYQNLGISIEELENLTSNFYLYLNSLRQLRKEDVTISEEQVKNLNQLFTTGQLTPTQIKDICPTLSEKVIATILDKYTQLKLPLIDQVSIEQAELPRLNLGYNYNNYMIASQETFYRNLIRIIPYMSEEVAQDIVANNSSVKEITPLLAFLNYFTEFDEELLCSIIRNYPRATRHMKREKFITEETLPEVMHRFTHFLKIVETYDSADDITVAALGRDIAEKILGSDNTTSKNLEDYKDIYPAMLERNYTFIPPVTGIFDNYYYESAHDADPERLLIGKNCACSCIGIDSAGEEAYLDCLTGHNADVILIKEQSTNDFYARILCFRRGNYIVLAPIYSKEGLATSLYNKKFLDNIAREMLEAATTVGDTLEYVFLSPAGHLLDDTYPIIEDSYLSDPFPHADLDEIAYLIASKKNLNDVEIDSTIPMPVFYPTKREEIKTKEETTETELTRLKALSILMNENSKEKEEQERDFEPVSLTKYEEIYKGQDWYIGMNSGQIIEEVVLPIENSRRTQEIEALKKNLQTMNMLTTSHINIENQGSKGGKK